MTTLTTEIVLPGITEPSGLRIRQRTLPAPTTGQALVQMDASGVSFAEQSMRRGRYPGQPRFPFVPGYDMVGTVRAVGPGVRPDLIGTRVAAALKTGGWATHLLVPARTLVPVPPTLDPTLVEAVIVNGITAWQMLHRHARVQAGQTVLVHGANGGVGTILVQLARHAGARVIGTAAPQHHTTLRALGVEPVNSRDPKLSERVRTLAPDGVHAAFDHLGLTSARASHRLLARGGRLIAYGTASNLKDQRSVLGVFAGMLAQLAVWNLQPDGRRASFYDFWGDRWLRPAAFQRRLSGDLTQVLELLARGVIVPQVAARMPLTEAGAALALAESRTVLGKVVLIP